MLYVQSVRVASCPIDSHLEDMTVHALVALVALLIAIILRG
jgi:hypothetical protein